ncbi:hypothetical protein PYW07_007443 [Mythimna separata]|uniref:Protein cueball n=1 Tax=Mythimna separata TaxID=271217 RepID=A0AAD8E150_MYTSE|nr:hypothetical protein PYW07_007443 [Mythimna separata]
MCRMLTVLVLVAVYVVSVHSWDIAVSNGDLLQFYINQTKIDTVRFKSQNLAALAYDEVHNMILYVDKQSDNDTICGFNMSTMQYKYLTERSGRNIRGLAFDPATELLFFTDTKERSINWISLKSGSKNSVYGTILIKMDVGIPTDIAVDSCRGYIYWINTNLTTPTIERARFNGTEREVVIHSSSVPQDGIREPYNLAIDQQKQKIYWFEPSRHVYYDIYSADLNGNNKDTNVHYTPNDKEIFSPLNALTVLGQSLFFVGYCPLCTIWNFQKSALNRYSNYTSFPQLHKEIPVSIVANYKLSDQIQGIRDCQALTSLVQNKSPIDNTYRIATLYGAEVCVHGTQVDGLSLCECSPGYTGERCDVPVCENYCIHGNCSVNEESLPECSCAAGYSGERCQVDPCHGYCQNGGDCSLNGMSEPVCECKGDFVGVRCEVSACLNYCVNGNCTVNDGGLPKCSCAAGYSGERCEFSACQNYCLNDYECILNEEDEPVCECGSGHEGSRCEVVRADNSPSIRTSYSAGSDLTLTDIFSRWRKPVSKMTVILESS